MSFAGTPLGQGRRLDHNTFLGKPPSSTSVTASSYSYGAPALGSRSPPKIPSPTRNQHDGDGDDENDSALSRFAKIKQARDLSNRPGGPKIISSPPKPEKWSVKDTSVNIATAFTQAAAGSTEDMTSTTYSHNTAWASTSRNALPVPRSTSVEYEAAAPHTTNRRLPAPPDKFNRSITTTTATRKPLSKTPSLRHVPDSEGEEDHSTTAPTTMARGRSPFDQGLSLAKNALSAAAYYVRHRSREPDEPSMEQPQPSVNGGTHGNDSSYDYAAEEQIFQAQKRNHAASAAVRRNRMSIDNKAYKPSQESEDEGSEWSDDGKTKRRRRKLKKGPGGGPLSTLPVVTADKKRRRKGHGSRGNLLDPDEEESESEDNTQADTSISNNLNTSIPDSRVLPSRQYQEHPQNDLDDSMLSAEQGLQSIPEVEEEHLSNDNSAIADHQKRQSSTQPRRVGSRTRSRSRTPAPHSAISHFSIGGVLGSIVHLSVKLVMWSLSGIISGLSLLTFLFGQVFGTTFDLVLRRPAGWARGAGTLVKYLVPALVLVVAWYILHDTSLSSYASSLSFPMLQPPRYHAPNVPPADIAELAERLRRIEKALSGLSHDTERATAKTEDGIKGFHELQSRLNSLEGKIGAETKKAQDAETKARDAISRSINGVKQEVEILQSQLAAQRKQQEREREQNVVGESSDEEARARLKALEERVGGVEGGIKEALEQIAKKAAAAAASPATGPAWWNKIASGIGVIRSADGQDVTAVISQLVHSAVSTLSKDLIAKPDFALHSGGARIIPSLTSPTLEARPKGFAGQMYALVTGTGYAIGRPPVTTLHHELHNGYCWPFAGQEGQLGVMLARPAIVEEVTIDHLPNEVAYDVRSAPRQMEVWGMVEGEDNIARVKAWKEAGQQPEDVVYPNTLPRKPEYIRLVNFTYDIHAPNHVQTFSIDPEIRALGLDFGVAVLKVLSNWGLDYTCLYRFRVHGQMLGGVPLPEPVVEDRQESS